MTNTLKAIATAHRLHLKRGEDGLRIIPGKHGELFDYSRNRLGLLLTPGTVAKWNHRRRVAVAAGMVCTQDGDDEGILTFNPDDREQLRVALKLAGIRATAAQST